MIIATYCVKRLIVEPTLLYSIMWHHESVSSSKATIMSPNLCSPPTGACISSADSTLHRTHAVQIAPVLYATFRHLSFALLPQTSFITRYSWPLPTVHKKRFIFYLSFRAVSYFVSPNRWHTQHLQRGILLSRRKNHSKHSCLNLQLFYELVTIIALTDKFLHAIRIQLRSRKLNTSKSFEWLM